MAATHLFQYRNKRLVVLCAGSMPVSGADALLQNTCKEATTCQGIVLLGAISVRERSKTCFSFSGFVEILQKPFAPPASPNETWENQLQL